MADIKLKQPRGLEVSYNDNPLLNDPGVRFIEKMFAVYEQELGEEGEHILNVTGMHECIDRWCQCNGFSVQA